jgi:hypothetical protein
VLNNRWYVYANGPVYVSVTSSLKYCRPSVFHGPIVYPESIRKVSVTYVSDSMERKSLFRMLQSLVFVESNFLTMGIFKFRCNSFSNL